MMRHRDESLGWLFKLGWLTTFQLARLLRPSPKVLPGRSRYDAARSSEPAGWGRTTAQVAMRDLERLGLVRSEKTIPPWRRTGGGRPALAYCLTRTKGMEAGALAAGEAPGEEKRSRGKYMRSMISPSRINHALLRNEWLATVAAQAPRYGAEVEDAWAEGGATLRAGGKKMEPDGRVELLYAGRSILAYMESDTGSQRREAVMAKVADYGTYLIESTCYGTKIGESGYGLSLPLVVFVSKSATRSLLVRDYLRAELGRERYRITAAALGEGGLDLRDLFLVTSLEWASEREALGWSCLPAGSREMRSVLEAPHTGRRWSGTSR